MARILVVEDDPGIRLGLVRNLEFDGHQVIATSSGETGLKMALEENPDLMIFDVMLPEIDGFEICRIVRKEGIDKPILFLTARHEETDKVEGLRIGADDYITKPFGVRELLARVGAALRRARKRDGTDKPYCFGDFEVDFIRRRLKKSGTDVDLTEREFLLLACLITNVDRALSRDAILREVWGYGYEGTARTIDNFVTRLRRKLGDDSHEPRLIRTIRGFGYRFTPQEES